MSPQTRLALSSLQKKKGLCEFYGSVSPPDETFLCHADIVDISVWLFSGVKLLPFYSWVASVSV